MRAISEAELGDDDDFCDEIMTYDEMSFGCILKRDHEGDHIEELMHYSEPSTVVAQLHWPRAAVVVAGATLTGSGSSECASSRAGTGQQTSRYPLVEQGKHE